MSKYLQIQIPNACHENWDRMDAAAQGKFCNACQKDVVDFTLMSDNDLANFFKKKKKNVCGRFYSDQLNTNIAIPARKIPWLKYFFQVLIPAILFSSKANAQTNTKKGEATCVKTSSRFLVGDTIWTGKAKIETNKIVTGQIIDEKGKPIEGASVHVKNTPQGVAADADGRFIMTLHPLQTALVISAVGFTPNEVDYANDTAKKITLKFNTDLLSTVSIVTAGAIRKTMGCYTVTSIKKENRRPLATETIIKPEPAKGIFSLYPDPVHPSSALTIKWKNAITASQSIEIYTSAGERVQSNSIAINAKITQQSIQLKQIPAGSYIIKITDSKTHKLSSQQFIVE